jgi:hypothetical protein
MVRISKQSERRAQSPRRPRVSSRKTEEKTHTHLPYKKHPNALEGSIALTAFIPKIK